MARNIAVRIKTEKVIEALETSLETMRKDKETETARKDKYAKDLEAWEKKVKEYALKMPKPKDTKDAHFASHAYYLRGNDDAIAVQFTVAVPKDKVPTRPEAPETMADWEYREAVENIENALRLLRMTDQEEVSTGTYNKIAKYL